MIYVLYGEDEFRRSERRRALVEELLAGAPPDFALTTFRGKAFNEAALPQLYELPFLASHKVVVITEAETLSRSELKLLTHYFQKPAEHTRLIVEFAQSDKPALPEGEKIRYERFSELRAREITDWLLREAEALGLQLPPESATLLVELLGTDLRLHKQTLQLFQIYRGIDQAAPLTPSEISEALGLNPQYPPYRLINAIAEGKVIEALRTGAAFADDVRNYPLSQILWHLRTFYQNLAILHLTRTPATVKAIQERLGLRFAFQAKPYEGALKRFSLTDCRRALSLLRLTEARQKGIHPSRQSERQLLLGMIEALCLPPAPTLP